MPLLLLELPDKTFIATLVLASRFRSLAARVGVGLAFGVQTALAVSAGGLLSRLPEALVAGGAAVLFVAERGDLSQLFTAGLAATLGATLASRLPLRAVRLSGAAVCVVLAVLAGLQAAGVPVPL